MTDDRNWKQCPEGILSEVQNEQKRREESPVMARRVALGLLVSVGATAGVLFSQSGAGAQKLTCAAALKMAPEFLAGTLSDQDLASVEAHLGHCPSCRRKIQKMQTSSNA